MRPPPIAFRNAGDAVRASQRPGLAVPASAGLRQAGMKLYACPAASRLHQALPTCRAAHGGCTRSSTTRGKPWFVFREFLMVCDKRRDQNDSVRRPPRQPDGRLRTPLTEKEAKLDCKQADHPTVSRHFRCCFCSGSLGPRQPAEGRCHLEMR
jgi:hypothetical protein